MKGSLYIPFFAKGKRIETLALWPISSIRHGYRSLIRRYKLKFAPRYALYWDPLQAISPSTLIRYYTTIISTLFWKSNTSIQLSLEDPFLRKQCRNNSKYRSGYGYHGNIYHIRTYIKHIMQVDGLTFLLKYVALPGVDHLASVDDSKSESMLRILCAVLEAILDPSSESNISFGQPGHDITSQEMGVSEWEAAGDDLTILSTDVQALVNAHLDRFRQRRDNTDLERSMYLMEIMTQLLDTSISSTPTYIGDIRFVLFTLHTVLYSITREPAQLEGLIDSLEQFLATAQGPSDYASKKADISFGLAWGLSQRLENTPSTRDCDRILQLYEEIPTFTSGVVQHRDWDNVRAIALLGLSRLGRKFDDLTGTLDLIRAADDLQVPFEWARIPLMVLFLVFQLKVAALAGDKQLLLEIEKEVKNPLSRCDLWGGIVGLNAILFSDDSKASLDDAIATLRDKCSSCPLEDPCCALYSIVLATALVTRWKRLEDRRDLQEAMSFRAPFEPDKILKVDMLLFDMAQDYAPMIGRRWLPPEVAKGWACMPTLFDGARRDSAKDPWSIDFEFALRFAAFTPENSPVRQHTLIIDALFHPSDDKKFKAACELLLSRCECSENPSEHLFRLCRLYRARYEVTWNIVDVEVAAEYYLKALSHPNNISRKPGDFWLVVSIFDLEDRKPGSMTQSQLLAGLDKLQEVVSNTTAGVADRFKGIRIWFICLQHDAVWEQRRYRAIEMGNLALSLLEQQCWEAPTPHASLQSRLFEDDLLCNVTISIMRADSPRRALMFLEAGRSLLWNQLESLRTPPSELASVPPELASRFLELSRTLERRMGFSHDAVTDPLGTFHQQLVEDRDQVIKQIRALPGLESFLQNESYFDLGIVASAEGPVVLLLPDLLECVAFILVDHGFLQPFNIPIRSANLKRLHKFLRSFTSTRGAESDGQGTGDSESTTPTSQHEDTRAGARNSGRIKGVEDVLEELWGKVAKPVIDKIMKTMLGSKWEGKADIPVSCDILLMEIWLP